MLPDIGFEMCAFFRETARLFALVDLPVENHIYTKNRTWPRNSLDFSRLVYIQILRYLFRICLAFTGLLSV